MLRDIKVNALIGEKESTIPGFKSLKKLYRYYKIINHEKPDIVISFMEVVNLKSIITKLFMGKSKTRFIISVHIYLSGYLKNMFLPRIMRKFYIKEQILRI